MNKNPRTVALTVVTTITGIIGSILSLISNASVSSNTKMWLTLAGGIVSLLFNFLSSCTGFITNYL